LPSRKTNVTKEVYSPSLPLSKIAAIAYDKENNPLFFAESEWMLKLARENFPSITFHETSDFKIRENKKS